MYNSDMAHKLEEYAMLGVDNRTVHRKHGQGPREALMDGMDLNRVRAQGLSAAEPGAARVRAVARWLAAGVWAGSWYLMYLEITRWHHVKPSLAFNVPPADDTGIHPHPGLPLLALYVACVAAPITVLTLRRPRYPAVDRRRSGGVST
jgi:hypothetical protein